MNLRELEQAITARGLRGVQVSLGRSAVRKDQWFANAAEKQSYGDTLSEAIAGVLDQIEVVPEQPVKRRRRVEDDLI